MSAKSSITIISLDYHDMAGGRDHLVMHMPKVREIIAFQKSEGSDEEKEAAALASLCGVDIDVILDLAVTDFTKLQQAFIHFLDRSPGLVT